MGQILFIVSYIISGIVGYHIIRCRYKIRLEYNTITHKYDEIITRTKTPLWLIILIFMIFLVPVLNILTLLSGILIDCCNYGVEYKSFLTKKY